jgi:Protein of unknown function (DUF2950)
MEVVSTGAAASMAAVDTGDLPHLYKRKLRHGEQIMRNTNLRTATVHGRPVRGMFIGLAFALLSIGQAQLSFSQTSELKTFSSPGEASNALFQAVQNEDEQTLEAILGAGKEVTSSSDEVEDKLEREQFCQKYKEMHRWVQEPDGNAVLYIGAENWPFPVPLVSNNGEWHFDSGRGKQEILFRRIGENEAAAIEVCQEFAMAKNASAAKADSEDAITRYAESLATAAAASNDNKAPFHGYYFRIVTETNASAGEGRTKKALTLIAYPAEYHSSGVKTFVVSRKGTVFEKDLGPETKTLAPQMKSRTGSSWHRTV